MVDPATPELTGAQAATPIRRMAKFRLGLPALPYPRV